MRGSIEMNIIEKIASRGMVFVLAVAILGAGFIMTADNDRVANAETMGAVYLTNKATAKTTEASPPTARAAPASRKNASTVYVTMTDVDTTNAVGNSHLLDANKVVITVTEPDHNSKVIVDGGANARATAIVAGATTSVTGSAGDPVIDTDSDGDLTDEISILIMSDHAENTDANTTWDGTAASKGISIGTGWTESSTGAPRTNSIWTVVSVANATSATSTTVAPNITLYLVTVGAHANGDDIFVGYHSSAVNTFDVTAWSTVQLEANASRISVVETGRNTGVFEAEFIVADTEGVNDNLAEASTSIVATGHANTACGTSHGAAVVSASTPADGRWDKYGGTNADCEFRLVEDFQLDGASDGAGATAFDVAATLTLGAGEFIIDADGDGVITDSIFLDAGSSNSIAAGELVLYPGDGTIVINSLTCSGTDTTCMLSEATARNITLNITSATDVITNGNDDTSDVLFLVGNNVVDNQKVDSDLDNDVDANDLKSGRIGSDTKSTGGSNSLGTATKSGVLTTGTDRTPVVEAQANSTITVQYQDLTDGLTSTTATAGTKQKATVTVDSSAPAPTISSPVAGSSFKDRQPTFKGAVSDIGSGIDVSTVSIYVDMTNAVADATQVTSAKLAGSWLGGAGTINLVDKYDAMAATMDNTTTMVDGVTSLTWTVTTSANIPCATGSADGTAASGLDDTGASTHTNFVGAISCNTTVATPDVTVDYFISATDLAGNRGFSDSITTDVDAAVTGDPYTINIDEVKPSLDSANTETGVYYNAGTTAEKTGSADRMVVAFDDEILSASAGAFKITTDAGTVMTPIAAEVGVNVSGGTDFRKNVYLTLPSALATNETPKVELIDNVSDLAGNTNKSGTITGAVDKLKPVLTMTVSGGSGTGTDSNAADKLTKSAMIIDITTSEVLSGNPTVSLFTERYGTTGTSAVLQASCDLGTLAAAASLACATVSDKTVIDTDKDGSLTDELTLSSGASNGVTATVLAGLTVASVVNSGEDVTVTLTNGSAEATVNTSADIVSITAVSEDSGTGSSATTTDVAAEGTVASVAVDSLNYKATFAGTAFSDASTEDSKSILLSATDVNGNTGTLGHRDQANAAATTFRLDKTAPVLSQDPDGDGTPGSSTTLPRPYVIWDFTDNSNVTVNTATFGGDDVLALLATTNNKKYFMVPAADLAAATYAVAGKGTDLAGNAGTSTSYNLAVTARKDYKATILAGWNLMSFPSDPVDGAIGSVFTNTGIDQVVGYDASAKGSPWTVATSDAGTFSGSLTNISEGNGYWVHSTEFSTQAVALTGPEGPSASAPPSISSIPLASGWNLVGVTDATKANTQANEGACIDSMKDYLGADGGSSVTKAYEYNTTNLAWTEVDITNDTACASATDAQAVNAGEAFWVFAKPDSGGLLTPIVP